jgi:hypothetical protein
VLDGLPESAHLFVLALEILYGRCKFRVAIGHAAIYRFDP